MKKLPQVSGLVLCDRVLFDTGTLEYTYSGVFHTLNLSFSDTPPHLLPRNQWPLRPFTVCGTLFNGDVEGRMELLVSHLEWEKATYRQRRWVSYRPGRLYYLEIPVRECYFPAPGRYELTYSIEGTRLARRYFDILNRKE